MTSTVKAAVPTAAGQATAAGVVPANVVILTEGILSSMTLTKLKTVALVLLVLGTVAFGGRLLKQQMAAAEQGRAGETPVACESSDKGGEPAPKAEEKTTKRPGDARKERTDETGADEAAWANKLFEETVKDFGDCKRGEQLKYRFKMTNIYQVPLEVTHVRVSCECVTCSPGKKVLQPNETGYLEVTMDSRRIAGGMRTTIQVTVGPQYVSTATLKVSANVRPE
jgi:hypothetical protein